MLAGFSLESGALTELRTFVFQDRGSILFILNHRVAERIRQRRAVVARVCDGGCEQCKYFGYFGS